MDQREIDVWNKLAELRASVMTVEEKDKEIKKIMNFIDKNSNKPDSFTKLYNKIKKNSSGVNRTELLTCSRYIKMILGDWKLKVQSDIIDYLQETCGEE